MPSDGVKRLHPTSLLFGVGSAARRLLLPGLVVLFASRGNDPEFWMMLLFVPGLVVVLVRHATYRYRFTADDLVIREGLVRRNERHIPYARIQNIDLSQNPLQRWLGVAEVRLETAGGDKPEATMRVLSLDAVEELRRKVGAGRLPVAVTAPAATDPLAPVPLLRLSPREVALYGVISNRGMVVVAALLGLLWQFGPWERVNAVWLREEWRRLPGLRLSTSPTGVALLVLGGLVAALLLVRLLSIALAVFKYHDFRLTRAGEDLRASHGLLTRVAKTIPRHRIQMLALHEGPLYRLFGRAAIQAETAGGMGEGAAEADRLLLAPLVPRERLAELVRELVPDVDLERIDWQPIPRRAAVRLLRQGLVVLALLVGAALWASGPRGLALASLAPLAWIRARLYVRYTAWAVTESAVLYRSGFWIRRLSMARLSKIQAIALVSSPFDRRHRMAALYVDTAGGGRIGHPIGVRFLDAPVAAGLAERLAAAAARTTFRW